MKVTVCQLTNEAEKFEAEWQALVQHVQAEKSEFVLLPEMPFSPWLSADEERDADKWRQAVESHGAWHQRLGELGAPSVALTSPVLDGGRAFNEGGLWRASDGSVEPSHRKIYLPEEGGFWEARWYERGEGFEAQDIGGVRVGFMICTEMWFTKHARDYGKDGVQLLLSPRATLAPSVDKWIAGGRAAAVVSGAYSLSSNFSGPAVGALPDWGGAGWIVEPEEGDVLGVTSVEEPFLTVDIDLAVADQAKSTYPRYVVD